ncbi:MAG: cation:proton antiporter [Lapillicoccus sp.]
MSPTTVFLVIGLSLLLAVVLPTALSRFPVSAPMVLVGIGIVIGLTPLADGFDADPVANRAVVEHLTEVTVLVALMGVGLALDRPLDLRRRASWRHWSPTWRLLAVAMPLTIAAVALLGWWGLGLGPAAALLLGAALAPTDPVLASDVQVEGPRVGTADEIEEEDEVRFALTSEAGLNDGLAFPFVHAAVLLAGAGSLATWGLRWVGWDLVLEVALGVGVGYAVGRGLAAAAFRAPRRSLRLAEQGDPLLALAALLTAYGLSELVGGYGFLAVFTCAMTVRAADPAHGYHEAMHGVVERLERLLTLLVLLTIGIATTRGLLAHLDWRGVVVAGALVVVIRPAAAFLALAYRRRTDDEPGGITRSEAVVAACFGVRGVGSLYYLAYATGHAGFAEERWLWSTVTFTIVLSVFVHGVAVTPALAWLERQRDTTSRV